MQLYSLHLVIDLFGAVCHCFKDQFCLYRHCHPTLSLFAYVDEALTITLNLVTICGSSTSALYLGLFNRQDRFYWRLCLLIGYPMVTMARVPETLAISIVDGRSATIVTSFPIRIYAWMGILRNNGLLNNLLMWLGVIDQPLTILNTNIAVYIGIVYAYLPFMVLPLYSNLIKMDKSLIEAAQDLGLNHLSVSTKLLCHSPKVESCRLYAGSFIPAEKW